jgi:hypothetical protein
MEGHVEVSREEERDDGDDRLWLTSPTLSDWLLVGHPP